MIPATGYRISDTACLGFLVWGLVLKVWGLVSSLGFECWGLGFGYSSLDSETRFDCPVPLDLDQQNLAWTVFNLALTVLYEAIIRT